MTKTKILLVTALALVAGSITTANFVEAKTNKPLADSFFDIFTERFGNNQNAIDSFFDVFVDVRRATGDPDFDLLRNGDPDFDVLRAQLNNIQTQQLDEPTIFLNIIGQRQGQIQGDVTKPGRMDTIGVFAFSHDIKTPRDPASGLPTGKRQHSPIVITKEIDKSSPLIMQALVNNENLQVRFEFYRPSATGTEENYFTVELNNANIAGIERVSNIQRNALLLPAGETEQVSFTYQTIRWTWVGGGITTVDDWAAPTEG